MTNILMNKIDFVFYILVTYANPNGTPTDENRPRTDFNDYGVISDVCLKRKIRNRFQEMGLDIFVQSDEMCNDGARSLSERAKVLGNIKNPDEYKKAACEKWMDVRSFGNLFAFSKGKGDDAGVSVGVRGPVSIGIAKSVAPIIIDSMQITKSVNGETTSDGKKSSDTMGTKHFVQHGLYKVCGSISPNLAKGTGFTEEDANAILEAIRTLFVDDASSARPDGSMAVDKIYWFKHNSALGQYSAAKVHNSVTAIVKDGVTSPKSIDDYNFEVKHLEGLQCDVVEGF